MKKIKPNGIYKRKSASLLSDKALTPAFIIMLLPFLVLFTLFTVIPVISSIILSFFDYDVVNSPTFCGLQNYLFMFVRDFEFPITVKNTLIMAIVTGPVSFLLSFLLAWMINEFSPVVRSLLSFLFYSPALIGNGYFIWQVLFSGDSYGYMNSMLLSMNVISSPIVWFRSEQYVMVIVIIVQLWMGMGVSFLANIAGLNNVNPELYEAGAIDGVRNRWAELWYITVPSMKSILLFSSVMQIQSTFSISSIVTSLAGFPSVNNSVDTILTHIIDVGTTKYDLGYASALTVFLFVIMMFVRLLVGKLLVDKD